VQADSSYAKAHYSLALEYYYEKQYENSIEELIKVVELEPRNANAHFDLGVVYVEQFRKQEDAGEVTIKNLNGLEQGLSHYKAVITIDSAFPHAKENADIVETVLNEYMQ
jgi:tetratricopeptide (TPR) repeat protein